MTTDDLDRYYVRARGQVRGPFSVRRLLALRARGTFSRVFEVSTDRVTWSPVDEYPELTPTRTTLANEPGASTSVTSSQPLDIFIDDGAADWGLVAEPVRHSWVNGLVVASILFMACVVIGLLLFATYSDAPEASNSSSMEELQSEVQ